MNIKIIIGTLITLVLGFTVGRFTGHRGHDGHGEHAGAEKGETKFWTCSMHPHVNKPGPGKCPYCGMALIPVSKGASGQPLGAREIQLSPQARKLAAVETTRVERRYVDKTVRMVGKVDYDETRVSYITARVPGRMDRLYVDFTGVPVNKGDHLVHLYSPELLAAQEELIQAVKTHRDLSPNTSPVIRERTLQTLNSAREKLRLYDFGPEQVAEIEQRGSPSDHITIYSPSKGIVVEKHGSEGSYVNTGSKIYTIADLSQVWVKLDAYESDLEWVRYGQDVHFETEAFPGEDFVGKIAFVDPVLNPATRTVKVRVNVPNTEGRLKPGMFVRATVKVPVGAHGKAIAPDLAGKWISPMHPEIVKDGPGKCDVCGMDLVKAESLGYAPGKIGEAPLVIPRSAPLQTGKRAVVYVQVPDREGVYEGRQVVLGSRAGDYYVVHAGLNEGEVVVSSGAFKIDSAIQIQAKPSMMNPAEEGKMPSPAAFRKQLGHLVHLYFGVQKALGADQFKEAKTAVEAFMKTLHEQEEPGLSGASKQQWSVHAASLHENTAKLAAAADIKTARVHFQPLSNTLRDAVHHFGIEAGMPVFLAHCPMAFNDTGADWLAPAEDIFNPYFGAEMLRCGLVKETLHQPPAEPKPMEGHKH